jgi:DNA-binding NtrC family response regulator
MAESRSGTPQRILVVDDHQDICSFMQAALEEAGYEVQSAPEGAQALALQRERPADLLITDIFMPGQEGFETISRFKAEFPQIRIIVMSTGNIPGMKHDFLSTAALLGVGATLRKPFDADQLLDAVRRVLQPAARRGGKDSPS